jgi:NADPH2:quinone reductase
MSMVQEFSRVTFVSVQWTGYRFFADTEGVGQEIVGIATSCHLTNVLGTRKCAHAWRIRAHRLAWRSVAAMRAVTIRDEGVVVEEHPDPTPQAGELLVRVRAAGLNGADVLQVKGRYPAPPGSPQDIPGLEFAGEVVECGPGVHRFEPGDRVMAVVGGGGQAELITVNERLVMPVPDELDWPAAGGVPEVFTTAHDALFSQGQLACGERLLVHGAAGGVGTAALQLGQMAGARVTATVHNEKSRTRIAAFGIKAIAPEGFEDEGPFDVILELVGAPNFPGNLKALAQRGRICTIGVGAGAKVELNLQVLMSKRGCILASTLRARSLEDKAAAARLVEKMVLPGFASGDLAVPVAATFPIDDAAGAYEHFQQSGKLGKVVIEM